MLKDPSRKYRAFPQIDLPGREWPSRTITKAPRWLSTDLRDGNQSLIDPMNAEKKARFFKLLVKMGVKEIEVGFPSASQTDYDYVRGLVDNHEVPADVVIQGLVQAREDLIARTFESMAGSPRAIVHLYNAVSPAWRDIVFKLDKDGVRDIARMGAELLRKHAERFPETDWHFEYSPETFSTAELDFSLEVTEAVMEILEPTAEKPLILNLPATVEAATPNIYADQIEWMGRHISAREKVVISLHPHNDRGTGVAAAELGLMAGADRIEGCLFGNGERTGNVDLVTLGLNLYTQGVDPELDFSNMDELVETVEYCNQLPVHPRHPYAGELVFTAFSGSHQDAIKKGFEAQEQRNDEMWHVPYLPIDPMDLGRSYEAVIRVNSQSGKGGVAWVLQQDYGLKLPKRLQGNFSATVQELSDSTGRELSSADIYAAFKDRYLEQENPRFSLVSYDKTGGGQSGEMIFAGKIIVDGNEQSLSGRGNGLLSSLVDAISPALGIELDIIEYSEHSVGSGSKVQAASYVECKTENGKLLYGVGMDSDVGRATVKALLSAANSYQA